MSTAQDQVVVSVHGLVRRFGPLAAVDGVSFDVRRGEIFGLVGPDGAGKSTIMRMLAGVLGADGGDICLGGVDVLADPEAAKPHLSYMPQRFGLYEDLTVDENNTPARLKQAMPGALLAVVTDDARAAHAALQGAPCALGLLLMGDRVNVRVDDPDKRLPELRSRLADHGIHQAEITRVEPGIEDVFVALLGTETAP